MNSGNPALLESISTVNFTCLPERKLLPPSRQLQTDHRAATIECVQNADKPGMVDASASDPFQPGTLVVVTLGNPREKLWGAILSLSSEGLSLCGVELASFEDLASLVKEGETVFLIPPGKKERP